jgi:hypothetical protein
MFCLAVLCLCYSQCRLRYTNELIQAVVTAHQIDPLSQLPFLQSPGMLFLVALLESNQATGFFQSKSGIQQGI